MLPSAVGGTIISGFSSADKAAHINASLDAKLAAGSLLKFGLITDSTGINEAVTSRETLPQQGGFSAGGWFSQMVWRLGCGYITAYMSVPGETILQMRDSQLPKALAADKKPDILVVKVSLNQGTGISQGWGDSPTERAVYLGAVEDIIDRCHANGVGVWLMEAEPRSSTANSANIKDDFAALALHLPDIAKRKNVHRYIRVFTDPIYGGIDGVHADASYHDGAFVHQSQTGFNVQTDSIVAQVKAQGVINPYPVATMNDNNLLGGPWSHTTATTPTGWTEVVSSSAITWGTPVDDAYSMGTWAVTTARTTSNDRIQKSFTVVPGNKYLLQGCFRGPDEGNLRLFIASLTDNTLDFNGVRCRHGDSDYGQIVNHVWTHQGSDTSGQLWIYFRETTTELQLGNIGLYDLTAMGVDA